VNTATVVAVVVIIGSIFAALIADGDGRGLTSQPGSMRSWGGLSGTEGAGVYRVASSSPNVRLKTGTNDLFHTVQARVAGELSLGLRGVTADILVASMLRMCTTPTNFPALVQAVVAEREHRAKGPDDADGEVD
jgi:hypothetical protein